MTDETFRIFERRLSVPGVWVFPSTKNDGRALLFKRRTKGRHEASAPRSAGMRAVAVLSADSMTCDTRLRPGSPSLGDPSPCSPRS